jgi:hypothetical protein
MHVPAVQVCVAVHARPHMPQLRSSVWRSAQTVMPIAVHDICPIGHTDVPVHVAVPPMTWQVWPMAHARPHEPQLLLSVLRLTQAEPQSVWPVGHIIARQVPVWQVWPIVQTVPQPPQLLLSVLVLTHTPPHERSLVPHIIIARQVPAVQLSPAAQAIPHAPQLLASVIVSTHVPLQRIWPVGHGMSAMHAPP